MSELSKARALLGVPFPDSEWYRQIGPTSWIVYRDNQALWETTTEGQLLAWCRENGIVPERRPLTVLKVN